MGGGAGEGLMIEREEVGGKGGVREDGISNDAI